MIDLTATLAKALEEVVQRVQRSLVVLHNGHQGVGAGIIWRSDGVIVTTSMSSPTEAPVPLC